MRKEYRVCLNLNNLHHKYIEEQIQKRVSEGEEGSGTKVVIQALYDYFRLNKIAARWPAKAVAQFYFY